MGAAGSRPADEGGIVTVVPAAAAAGSAPSDGGGGAGGGEDALLLAHLRDLQARLPALQRGAAGGAGPDAGEGLLGDIAALRASGDDAAALGAAAGAALSAHAQWHAGAVGALAANQEYLARTVDAAQAKADRAVRHVGAQAARLRAVAGGLQDAAALPGLLAGLTASAAALQAQLEALEAAAAAAPRGALQQAASSAAARPPGSGGAGSGPAGGAGRAAALALWVLLLAAVGGHSYPVRQGLAPSAAQRGGGGAAAAAALAGDLAAPAPAGDIAPASPAVLARSLVAARLAELSYPANVLPPGESSTKPNTDAAADAAFKRALTAALAAAGLEVEGWVDRYSIGYKGARYLHAFVAVDAAAARGGGARGVWVVLRGTDMSPASLAVDLTTSQVPLGDGDAEVHSGFYLSLTEKPGWIYGSQAVDSSALEDVSRLVDAALSRPGVGGPGAPITLVGHSLGGAQASLAAHLLVAAGHTNVSVITFGSPQAGDEAWRRAFDAQLGDHHWRWWNMQDAVPQTPNAKIDPGSLLVRQEWWSTDTALRIATVGGELRCGTPSGALAVCDASPGAAPPRSTQRCFVDVSIPAALSSADHLISAYVANLGTCLGGAGAAAW
ncbi:faeA [Scenedesmus sp. PABB004]|nr:faeA [Scenedesmus sp. PABB004]